MKYHELFLMEEQHSQMESHMPDRLTVTCQGAEQQFSFFQEGRWVA